VFNGKCGDKIIKILVSRSPRSATSGIARAADPRH
jgi:hypothetical protein